MTKNSHIEANKEVIIKRNPKDTNIALTIHKKAPKLRKAEGTAFDSIHTFIEIISRHKLNNNDLKTIYNDISNDNNGYSFEKILPMNVKQYTRTNIDDGQHRYLYYTGYYGENQTIRNHPSIEKRNINIKGKLEYKKKSDGRHFVRVDLDEDLKPQPISSHIHIRQRIMLKNGYARDIVTTIESNEQPYTIVEPFLSDVYCDIEELREALNQPWVTSFNVNTDEAINIESSVKKMPPLMLSINIDPKLAPKTPKGTHLTSLQYPIHFRYQQAEYNVTHLKVPIYPPLLIPFKQETFTTTKAVPLESFTLYASIPTGNLIHQNIVEQGTVAVTLMAATTLIFLIFMNA